VICYYRKMSLCLLMLVLTLACNASDQMPVGFSTGRIVMLISGLIGGLGLFLMGIKMMSDSMTKSTGNQIRDLLAKLTNNKFVAFFIGIITTVVFQSSSATTVMLISFVNSRLMKFSNTVGIIFGAAVGATVTIQLIAFRLTDYALTIIALGFILYMVLKQQKLKSLSLSIIGFGILFLGMNLISQSIEPLKTAEGFTRLLLNLEHPLTGILIGALLTALIQSSSAFIGILIILGGQGLITLTAAVPLIIGSNIGTAITALIAAAGGSRESKQVALAHTLFKVIGSLIIVWFIPLFVKLIISLSPGDVQTTGGALFTAVPRQIANAHTVFNTIIALLFLPFTNSYARFINKLLPLREEKHTAPSTWYIDEGLLRTPALALSVARQEVLRMMEIAQRMTEDVLIPFMEHKTTVLAKIKEREKEMNFLRDTINGYVVRIIRQDVTSSQVEEAYQMMYAVDEFEQIGDIISVTLMDKAEKWCNSDFRFSAQGKEELRDFHLKTLKILYQTYTTFSEANLKGMLKGAKKSKEKYNHFRKQFFELEKQHYERLKMEVEDSIESSRTHMEIIASLKVIGSHATNIARIMLKEQKNGGESANRSQLEGNTEG
jgi:phosphate:Na+ symporter